MDYTHKAVVLGSNYYIGLAVVRTLGRKGIPVVTVNHDEKNPYGDSRYVSEALIAPHYRKEEEAYLNFLLDYGKKQNEKPVLLPTADPYVEFVEKHFFALKEVYLFPQTEPGLLLGLMEKDSLTEYTKAHGVKTPEIISSDDPMLYTRVQEELGYPCILKPVDSPSFVKAYREKAFTVNREEELRPLVEQSRKDGHRTFVQRIIPGPETNCYCYDAYLNQEGKVIAATSAYKIRQWPNFFGASTLVQQKWIPELDTLYRPFLEALGYKGFVEIEIKRDENTKELYLIEVNVRFINFTQMLIAIGMDTPYYTYEEMTTGKVTVNDDFRKDFGVKWRYLLEDIAAKKGYRRKGVFTRAEMAEQEKGGKMIASTFAIDDPLPGIRFALYHLVKKLGRMVGKRG